MTGKQLKKVRTTLNMSLGQLATALNLAKGRVDSMERLGRPIPDDVKKSLTIILKKKVIELNKTIDAAFML